MSDKARIQRRCTHTLLSEVTHFRSLGIPYSQRSNGGGSGSTEALTASAGQVSLASPCFFPWESRLEVMVTWSVPGKNLGSPQERCWPSGLSALRDAVVCLGMLTGSGLWPWCVTVISASSSSRGDF